MLKNTLPRKKPRVYTPRVKMRKTTTCQKIERKSPNKRKEVSTSRINKMTSRKRKMTNKNKRGMKVKIEIDLVVEIHMRSNTKYIKALMEELDTKSTTEVTEAEETTTIIMEGPENTNTAMKNNILLNLLTKSSISTTISQEEAMKEEAIEAEE